MAGDSLDLAEVERRLALIQANLSELVEQAAVYSGAADEDLASQRIAELEVKLNALRRQRDKLFRNSRGSMKSVARRGTS